MKIIDFIIEINERIVIYANYIVTTDAFDKVNIFEAFKREIQYYSRLNVERSLFIDY